MKVFIIAAVSADGYIARTTEELADWTSKEDKKLFVTLTKRAGVIVMGSTTYRTIGRPLPGRRNIVYSHRDMRQEGIEVTHEAPTDLVARLSAEGYEEVAICGGQTIYDLFLQADLVDELYLTIEPVLFGKGVSLCQTPVQMRLLNSEQLNGSTLLAHYEVIR